MSTRTREGPFPGITRPHHACPSLSRPKIPCDKPAYKAIDPCGTRFISGDLGLPVTEAIANLSGEPEGLEGSGRATPLFRSTPSEEGSTVLPQCVRVPSILTGRLL